MEVDTRQCSEEMRTIYSRERKKSTVFTTENDVNEIASENYPSHEKTSSLEDKKLLFKIDCMLLPLFVLLYSVQYMDKSTSSFASIMGIMKDLNMTGDQYSWSGTSFYIGYLAFEFIASYLLQLLPLAKTTSVFIFVWGVIVCLHPVANYAGFIALRTLLGCAESAITPSMVILTSQWWKKEEQFFRMTLWFGACGIGDTIASLIAYGLYVHGNDSWSVTPWKVLYIVCGLSTVLFSFLFYFHVPDKPTQAWFLTDREKYLVVERIKDNKQGFGDGGFKKYQFIEAITDYKTWVLFLFGFANCIPNGGLGAFSSILLNDDFKYSTKKSLIMNIPCDMINMWGSVLLAFFYTIGWVKHRILIALLATAITLTGSCMLAFSTDTQVMLAGYYIMNVSPLGMICALSCFSSNVSGSTKKSAVNAIYLIGYCVGNLTGPQTYTDKQYPQYTGAKIAIVVSFSASILFLFGMYFMFWFENKRKDKAMKLLGPDEYDPEDYELSDYTDKENPYFRYTL